MGWWLTMRRVVLPQAFRAALPPYGNVMIMYISATRVKTLVFLNVAEAISLPWSASSATVMVEAR
jgi:polar amino acid transport system permease protein